MTEPTIKERINNYLGNGGLWNPEAMEHDKVRTLLIDCRDYLAALTAQQEPVAWMWLEGTELLNGTEVEQFERVEFSREKPDDDAYGLTPLYTDPASGVKAGMPANRTDYVSRAMVDAFLSWRLPEDFSPDAGISFTRDYNQNTPYPRQHEPIGTNLFSADQAREMLEYVMRESRRLEGERATRAVEGMVKAFEGFGAGEAITRAADQVNAQEAGFPVEPEYLIRLRNALKGFKSDGAFAGDKDIVDYIDSLQSALQVAQQDRDNCYASLDNVRRRLHEIETFVTGDANEYRINKKLKDDEKSIKSLIEHLMAMADKYHTVNQLYTQAKERAEKADALAEQLAEKVKYYESITTGAEHKAVDAAIDSARAE